MRISRRARFAAGGGAALMLLGASGDAGAAGIAAARFGGEHGHPTTDNPTAIYYNPAGIAFGEGTHIWIDGVLALRGVTYTRPAFAADSYPGQPTGWQPDGSEGANSGEASLFNVIASPFFGIQSDFGTDYLAAGLSFSVPFGGSASWDANDLFSSSAKFPGAADGPQRWYTIDGTIQSMYITGAFAYRIEEARLSLGASVSGIRSAVKTLRARNADGTDHLVTPASEVMPETLKEGRSLIDVEGWQVGFGVGAMWEPVEDTLWIGASYTSKPNVVGGMTLKGTLKQVLGTGEANQSDVEFNQDLPDILRLGFRFRPRKDMEIRMFGDWTRWSEVETQCLLDANADGGPNCDTVQTDNPLDEPDQNGANGEEARGIILNLPRYWKDSFGYRLGYSYWFTPEIEAYLGAGYDSSAIDPRIMDPALTDAPKFTLGVGGKFQLIENLALQFTYTHVFYLTVDTRGSSVLDDFQSPTRQPSGDGKYEQMIDLFQLAADISF